MALINTIDQLKQTVRISGSAPFHIYQIYLLDARDQLLVPYLSSELVELLEQVDEASTEQDDKRFLKILPLVRRVLGPFAVMLSTDEMSINTGDSVYSIIEK